MANCSDELSEHSLPHSESGFLFKKSLKRCVLGLDFADSPSEMLDGAATALASKGTPESSPRTDDYSSALGVSSEHLAAAMRLAIGAASRAKRPFGATLLDITNLTMVAHGNSTFEDGIRFAHAEMNTLVAALRARKGLLHKGLSDYILVSTAEPCPMCASASVIGEVGAIVYGTSIDTLIETGLFQIRIRAADVVAASSREPKPLVLGGFLRTETDPLYRDFVGTFNKVDKVDKAAGNDLQVRA